MNQTDRLSTATRIFALSAVTGLGLLGSDYRLLLPLLVLASLATTVVYLSSVSSLRPGVLIASEATVSGLVTSTALPEGATLLPYLAALCLVAGLVSSPLAVISVLAGELVTLGLGLLVWAGTAGAELAMMSLAPWFVTGVGLGALGIWLRSVAGFRRPSADPSYEAAYRLVSQLRTVARRLSRGLDSTLIAREVSSIVARETDADQVAVFVRSETGSFAAVVYDGIDATDLPSPADPTFANCWVEQRAVAVPSDGGHIVGLPLRAGSRLLGAVVARVTPHPSPGKLDDLLYKLEESALRLDTALAFDEIRSIATSEERRRLAREIHDGIAQEIAALGYAVDSVAAGSESAGQRAALEALRSELSRIVADLRLSIFDLRSDVVDGPGLGQAVSDYVRQMGARSDMTVHVTLDEGGTRLRPEIEAELLRIFQEAMTNARRHSEAKNVWVTCKVRPQEAEIEVRDDGRGVGEGRPDSYGLRIMEERAERLGARLEVRNASYDKPHGTVVRVSLSRLPHVAPSRKSGAWSDAAV